MLRRSLSIVLLDYVLIRESLVRDRYDSTSGGEREIQRTMLELLNQLDGFDDRGDVKVIMATNKVSHCQRSLCTIAFETELDPLMDIQIESLDPALIRPGRIDRKIGMSTQGDGPSQIVCLFARSI